MKPACAPNQRDVKLSQQRQRSASASRPAARRATTPVCARASRNGDSAAAPRSFVDGARAACLDALLSKGHSAQEAAHIIEALAGPAAPAKAAPSPTKLYATQVVHGKTSVVDPYGASGAPLFQTATFAQPSATTFGPYDYTRSGNPTRTMLEEQMAAIEGGDRSFAFTSGMAAISTVMLGLVKTGEHIVAGVDIYGGTSRLLSQVCPNNGISVTNVDMADLEAVRRAIIPGKTKLVHIESPSNPRMQVCDIRAICAMAHEAGALACVDNSIMALFQRPLDLGADLSVTSGTKHLGGHSDLMVGILTVKGQELAKRVYFLQNAEGAGLAPFDCWLALRGLKTMALRMERAAENAARIADFLAAHPLVRKVNYAGLPSHEGHALHMTQAAHGGSLLSFTTGSVEASKIIVEQTKLFKVAVSFGSVHSLILLGSMSHAAMSAEERRARGLPDCLVRLSVGIEDVEDLIADLDAAMSQAMEAIGFDAAAAARAGQATAAATAAANNIVPKPALPSTPPPSPRAVRRSPGRGKSSSAAPPPTVEAAVAAETRAVVRRG